MVEAVASQQTVWARRWDALIHVAPCVLTPKAKEYWIDLAPVGFPSDFLT